MIVYDQTTISYHLFLDLCLFFLLFLLGGRRSWPQVQIPCQWIWHVMLHPRSRPLLRQTTPVPPVSAVRCRADVSRDGRVSSYLACSPIYADDDTVSVMR